MKNKSWMVQITLLFLLVIMADSLEIDAPIHIRKQRYSLISSVVNVISYGKGIYNVARKAW